MFYNGRWYLVYGMKESWGEQYGGVIASVINSVQIQILNVLYQKIAVALTSEWRQYGTDNTVDYSSFGFLCETWFACTLRIHIW